MDFSCRRVHLPTEDCIFVQKKCIFLQKIAIPCRKMAVSCRKMQHSGAHGRKPQESTGGFQGSRIKNDSQLSQDNFSLRVLVLLLLASGFWLLAMRRCGASQPSQKTNAPGIVLCKGALTGQSCDTPQSNSPDAIGSEIVSRLLHKTARYCNCNG